MDILKQFPSRYLTTAGLEEMGGEVTGTVTKIVREDMKNGAGQTDTKPVLYPRGGPTGLRHRQVERDHSCRKTGP